MNLKINILTALACSALNLSAAVPPAEQLLPADTLAAFTVPDWSRAQTIYAQSSPGQLWRDPEIKAFKEKFLNQFQAEVLTPLERELGIKFADYAPLLQGQLTLAVTRYSLEGASDPGPGLVLIIDTKDKTDQLKKSLADLKKKWGEAGKTVKSEKIRDTEFTTLVFTGADLTKTFHNAFPKSKKATEPSASDSQTNKMELIFGQAASLLLIGNNAQDLEKILARISGAPAPALADQADYQANQGQFRNAVAFAWVHLKPLVTIFTKKFADDDNSAKSDNPMAIKPEKVFAAIGLDGVKSFAASVTESPDGSFIQLFLSVPESERKGLFKIFAMEPKNANPPPFVPADVLKFSRSRLDLQKTWNGLEMMLAEISPELNGFIQTLLTQAGKDKDPNFDLKKSLISNLGDDLINIQKAPRSFTVSALSSPPSLWLIGSPNSDQLVQALRTVAGLLVPVTAIKEREFLGRKIYALPLPANPGAEDSPAESRSLSFTASGGYLAISSDVVLMEEYLRSNETKPKALAENSALTEAAQKVGGMSTSFFGYQNDSETMRTTVETLKRDAEALDKLFALKPAANEGDEPVSKNDLKTWLDFSLLPAPEKIARYFSFTVYSGATESDGLSFKFFTPRPPALKQ